MTIRFPTEAANADRMDDTPRGADEAAAGTNEATPGKGINQAGFVKDRDASRDSGSATAQGKDRSGPERDHEGTPAR